MDDYGKNTRRRGSDIQKTSHTEPSNSQKEGKPNSSYVRFWWFQDNKVVLINNFMDIHKAYQIKGTVEFKTEGPEVQRGKTMAQKVFEERGMKLPAKEVIILTPKEIYYLQQGPSVGKLVE